MTQKILEFDWKILRKLHAVAVERYCQGVFAEIDRISADTSKSFHQRYLDMYQLIKRRDKLLADTFDNSRRSMALFEITAMRQQGLLTEEEFSQFSQETRGVVELFLEGRKDYK